jgi:hypothetical protein
MADSTHWTILSAVQTVCAGINGVNSANLRKRLVLLEDDLLPAILIAPAAEGESLDIQTLGTLEGWSYPIGVALVNRANGFDQPTLQTFVNLRILLRDTIFQPFVPGTQNYDVRIDPSPTVELPTAGGHTYDVTGFKFYVLSAENRIS